MIRRALFGLCLLIGVWGTAAAEDQTPLNMGFYLPGIRDANQTDLKVSLQIWAEELGRKYKTPARSSTYNDMASLRQAILRGEINFVVAPGMELVETFGPDELAEGFASMHFGTDEGLSLVAREDAGVHQLADLRGKRVLRLANDRLNEVFLETHCRRQFAQACAEALRLGEEKRDVQSIHKVFFGQADAALVSLSALHAAGEMNPQVRARLRPLLTWKTKSLSFGLLSARTDPAYRDLVMASAMEAAKGMRGNQIMQIFKTDAMLRVSPNDLQPFRQLRNEHQHLLNETSKRKK